MNVVERVAATLAARGVATAWGMPGGDTLPLVDALEDAGIRFVLVRDEASAGFAADATAQLTGTPGVCAATLGPGLLNLVGGVTGALLDRAPVVAITSRHPSARIGTHTHMIVDQDALFRASAKHHARMSAANAHGELLRALAVARAPRSGPVWLEIPAEVATAEVPDGPDHPEPLPGAVAADQALIDRVRSWRRPVILVGFAGRRARVDRLADALHAPVITTYKAKGAVPEGTGWSAGAAGLSPKVDAIHRRLLDEADGLLLVGWDPVELRDHWLPGWGPDVEVAVVDEAVPTDVPTRIDALCVGPVAGIVHALAAELGEVGSEWDVDAVAAHRAAWQALFDEEGFGPATAVRAVREAIGGGDVCALDVGAHRITASHMWRCDRPDRLLQSNGLSSMGYGLPAALAAASTGRRAVALVGDMGLQMVAGELGTAVEAGLPVTVVVFDDASLSLIELKQRRMQRAEAAPRGVRFANPDWIGLARAFGGDGAVVGSADELTAAVREGLESEAVRVVAARIDARWYERQM